MKNFLIVDDHTIVRTGIKLILKGLYPTCVVKEAFNEKTALVILNETNFDMVFLDLNMPESDPYSLIHFLQHKQPYCSIVILTMNDEGHYAKRFFKLGIRGYLNKSVDESEIERAIQSILSGQIYVSETLKNSLTESVLKGSTENPFDALSDREFQVAQELIRGKTITQISNALNIHTSTVSTYKAKVFEKLKIPNSNVFELHSIAKTYKVI